MEGGLKEQKQVELDLVDQEIESVRAQADLDMEALRFQLEDDASATRDENTSLRDCDR